MSDSVPSVAAQGFATRFIQHGEPDVRNYNSGFIRKGSDEFLATRRFSRDKWLCEIIIKQLVGSEATFVRTLTLPRAHGREWHEDARLFWHNGRIYCAYTEGQYWMRPWVSVQKLALLRDDWSVERVFTIGYAVNSWGQEKNWQFFSHDERLHFVYLVAPHVVVELNAAFEPTITHSTVAIVSEQFRGGTPPVRLGDYYVTFPHYHGEHKERARRYGFAAYLFEAKPPFTMVGITDPLILGSADDPTLPNLAYPHWHPIVVFPCGAILNRDTWDVCAGINDSYDAIFSIPHASLKFKDVAQPCESSAVLR